MTPSGIEPATFRLVARCLNHYANALLSIKEVKIQETAFFCLMRYFVEKSGVSH
jgi:hypothetical protein